MSKRTKSHHPRPSMLRTRAAVVAAGLGVSTLLGAGVSVAAESAKSGGALPGVSVNPVQAQAAAQAKAAEKAKQGGVKKAAAKAPAWVQPVERYTLSATFGLGGNMWSHKHSGQDFAVSVGTPVAAVHGGTVVKAGPNGAGDGPAYGNAVVIKHSNGTYSQYAHLSKVDVRVGQNVTTGQRVALSGNTGNSSGPHLHFEIRTTPNYGTAVDPVAFLRSVGVKV
ncbi:M23 family peptidase [Streptomyces sp. WAC 01529]|uniref:M23 family metallopeptidase n=1 Tax=Streptomyces sp. WAC 01529 TaxID=2203205 RepID=UPI000F6E447C|nr:M23 family metallopeptidase [Streptomyces sp. WAC 01529]AZM54690.1 M23 family peptidase [Streptomyces sp. WAC 01529]